MILSSWLRLVAADEFDLSTNRIERYIGLMTHTQRKNKTQKHWSEGVLPHPLLFLL